MKLQQFFSRAMLPLTVLACGATAHAQTLLRTVNGPAASAQFGRVCIRIPDQNSDGFDDVLVGAPEFNLARGAIYCISGAYLATGSGTQTLWSLAPSANPGDQFGFALADVGDVTGDNLHDFLVGQPGYDDVSGPTQKNDVGAVRLVHGSSHTVASLIHGGGFGHFGAAIAVGGDFNANGVNDVAIAAPHNGLDEGVVRLVEGFHLTTSGNVTAFALTSLGGAFPSDALGTSVVSGFDLTGDGVAEVVAGVPGYDSGGAQNAGRVIFYDVVQGVKHPVDSFISGEAFGSSVSMGQDYDGDGVADVVVGAPKSPNGTTFEVGRAAVLSSARVIAHTPPYEIFSFPYGTPPTPASHADPDPNFHYGAAVLACPDLTNDGVGEILIGAPDYYSVSFSGVYTFRGLVHVFSGATGTKLESITGAANERIGDALSAIQDLDGNGFREFVFGGSMSDTSAGTDSGQIKCYQLFPVTPAVYCVGKLNSLGCTPFIGFIGSPSASSSSPFLVTAANFLNNKNGVLFYSHAPAAMLFQGGTLCVKPPTKRTPVQDSGGSPPPNDCSGTYSLDFNARIQSGIDPTLVAGAEVFAQYWSRDPSSASQTSLSNALRFLVQP